jgi:flavin-dependent dehydrogenase
MRVGIVGDGIAGRTLYRILKMRGVEVDLYGQEKYTRCNIRPCGFATGASCINLVGRLGISPQEYVLRRDNYIRTNGREIKGDLYWIDKPKLIAAIATDIRYDKPNIDDYDIVVDATGVARVYSPVFPDFDDKKGITYQYRVILSGYLAPAFDVIRGGYLWTIPLGEREAHVGGGSTTLPPGELEQVVFNHVKEMKPNEIVCSCSEPIRLSGPIFPVVTGKFITVGESAGLVVSFGAAGIHTAFESAIILADHIYEGNIAGYDKAIRRRLGWLCGIQKIWDSVEKGQVALISLGASYRALRYQGLKPTLMDLLYIRKALIEANK